MSDSEDGLVRSPRNEEAEITSTCAGLYEDDEDDENEEDRDADSLNIKPPQAVIPHSRDREAHGIGRRRLKEKLNSSKDKDNDKKHSKDRRHKERSSIKERHHRGEREERALRVERGERENREYTSGVLDVGGNGNGGSSTEHRRDEIERYSKARANYDLSSSADETHDTRRGYTRHFERSDNTARSNHYHNLQHQKHQHQHQHQNNLQQQYHHVQHIQQRSQHHDHYERAGIYHHNSTSSGNVNYHVGGRQHNKHSGVISGNHYDDPPRTLSGGERERDRDHDRDRRKYAASNDQTVKDAESLEQDLRSRLLSKRHKYVRSSAGGNEEHFGERFDNAIEYKNLQKVERVRSRRDKKWDVSGDSGGAGSTTNSSVIEVLDSPEVQSGSKHNHKSRHRLRTRHSDTSPPHAALIKGKPKETNNPELLARRAKFLTAEREKEQRKESARAELQARRVKLRQRDVTRALSPSAVAASVTAGLNVIKRNVDEDDSNSKSNRKRKREPTKQEKTDLMTVDVDADDVDVRAEHASSEMDESGGSEDVSISLSPTPSQSVDDESESESHSDSGAAVSVKSASCTPKRGEANRKHKKRRDCDLYRSKNNDYEVYRNNDDVDHDKDESQHSYSETTKKMRKSSKHSSRKVNRDGLLYNKDVATNDSEAENRSSCTSVESEDSFYANRKREKRDKGVCDESSDEERQAKDFYHAKINKPSKSTSHKPKSEKRSKTKHREENSPSDSPISEGSVKTHRARTNHKMKLSGSANEQSGSLSDADSEVGSEDSYYTKKKQAHRHRHHGQAEEEGSKKSNRKSVGVRSNVSPSSVSVCSQEDDDGGDNVKPKNGVRLSNASSSRSGSDDDWREKKSRNAKYSHDANQFLADINDIHMTELSKDEMSNKKVRRLERSENSTGGNIISEEDGAEMEIVYDDKGVPLPNYYPGIQGCRTVEEFESLNRIEEGTYGVVYRARDQRTNEIVALKRLKMEKEREGFPITSLREINTLLKGQHPNIVTVREIVVGSNMDKIFIVMDYVEHDLKSLMETMKTRKQIFFPGEVKCLTQQLLRAVSYLHDNWILHRDLKTSNLLLSHKGILKVGDFGLAREYGSPLRKYTSLVVTRWYRAPELLLCSPMYSTPIDIWSVGCIFAEFLLMTPYLPGKSDIDQLNRIFRELGTPNEKIWPGYNELPAVKNVLSQNSQFADYPMSNLRKRFKDKVSAVGISLLQGLLAYDPKQRLTAEAALEHVYFKELPLPIDPAMFPTWPAKSEMGSARKAAHSPKPPSGGAQFKKLGQDDIAISVGKSSCTTSGGTSKGSSKVVSGIITGNKKTAASTGFVLNAGLDRRQFAGPGFNLKF